MIYKILRLFFNTLTADDKHYLLNRDNLTEPIRMQLPQKQKFFSEFFFALLKSILSFKHLPTEDFRKYRLRKTWLDKYLKSHVSVDPSNGNIANGSKHSCKLNDCPFNIFNDHCGGN